MLPRLPHSESPAEEMPRSQAALCDGAGRSAGVFQFASLRDSPKTLTCAVAGVYNRAWMASPIYAIVGKDGFLQMQAVMQILSEFPADVERIDVDGEKAQLATVLDDLRSFSMFGGGGAGGMSKVVIVRDADDFLTRYREQLEDYAAAPSNSGALVLRLDSLPTNQRIHKAISKVGKVINCTPPKERELPGWIMSRAKQQHKLTLPLDAANLLAELLGTDLGKIDMELAKLALQTDTGKVGAADVGSAVVFQREQAMQALTNELTSARPAAAVRRWRQLLETDPSSEFRAITWLGIWLEKLEKVSVLARERVPPFKIAGELRIWPASSVDGMIQTAEQLGPEGIGRAVAALAEADKRIKSGLGSAPENVERWMLTIASHGSGAHRNQTTPAARVEARP